MNEKETRQAIIEERRAWEQRRNRVRAALRSEGLHGDELEAELNNLMYPKP